MSNMHLTREGAEDARPVFIRTVQGHITENSVHIEGRVRVTARHSTMLWHTTKKELIPSIVERGLIPDYKGRSESFYSILDPFRAPSISASERTEILGWNDTTVKYVPYTYNGSVILTIDMRAACASGCDFTNSHLEQSLAGNVFHHDASYLQGALSQAFRSGLIPTDGLKVTSRKQQFLHRNILMTTTRPHNGIRRQNPLHRPHFQPEETQGARIDQNHLLHHCHLQSSLNVQSALLGTF